MKPTESVMTDEEFVRASWEKVEFLDSSTHDKCAYSVFAGLMLPVIGYSDWSAERAWSAAAEFTRRHIEKRRLVKEELHCIDYYESFQRLAGENGDADILRRILAREQSVLDELKRGLK